VRLTFRLTPKSRVGKIEFTGGRLGGDLLSEATKLRTGAEYSVEGAAEDRQRLLDLYKNHGYFQADIQLDASNSAQGREVDLRYIISEGKPVRIQSIVLDGAERISPDQLKKETRSKEGEVYQKQTVEEDVRRLRELYRKAGYLTAKATIELEYDQTSNTVVLRFKVAEGKKVTVKLAGGGIDKDALRKELVLLKRDSYSDVILNTTSRRLIRIYKQKGYYDPKVSYEIERETKDEVVIHFDIELGEIPHIHRIIFEENKAFDAGVLLSKMKTKPRSQFSIPGFGWLFSKGLFDPFTFETDLNALELFYRQQGYPDVKITEKEKEIDEKNRLTLRIHIEEGQQQTINVVKIEGNTIFETEQLLSKLVSKKGKPYSKETVARTDLLYLRSLYDKEGYIYANITPVYQPETGTLTYRISEGIQAKFGQFFYDGEGKVKIHVLRREFERLGVVEGAVFNPESLVKAQQRLFTLGLFRTIDIKTPDRSEGKPIIDVNVQVEVRKPGSISASGGYSPSEGPRITAGVAHNNLYRRNMRVGAEFSIGTRGNLYELTLIEPWLNPPLVGNTIGTFRVFEDNLEEHDDTRARGVTTNLAKRIGAYSNLAVQYKYQDLRQLRPDAPEIRTTVSSLGVSFHRDSRSHFLDPTSGWLNDIAVEYAGGFLEGETSFFKFTTDHRYYWQLRRDLVLVNAIRLGFEEGLRGNREQEIISFERFRAGGSTTVRGYRERSLGPIDEAGNHRGDVLFIFNTELRFPIYKFIGGVLFFDTGNVWNKLSDIDDSPLHSAVGAGLRADTPVGPARFDFGIPLRRGFDSRFYLELGHAF
jgi:outer membrane protein insertion porin family